MRGWGWRLTGGDGGGRGNDSVPSLNVLPSAGEWVLVPRFTIDATNLRPSLVWRYRIVEKTTSVFVPRRGGRRGSRVVSPDVPNRIKFFVNVRFVFDGP